MTLVALRGEIPPTDSAVIVRGGQRGLEVEVLRRTARGNFEDYGFFGISMFAMLDGTLGELCSSVDQLGRYGQVRLSTAGRLREAGFALLATGPRSHFDVVLPNLEEVTLERLASCFGLSRPNPGRRR